MADQVNGYVTWKAFTTILASVILAMTALFYAIVADHVDDKELERMHHQITVQLHSMQAQINDSHFHAIGIDSDEMGQ